ncbi:MAG: hypothetical protein J7L31_01850, partial [Thermoplasmata archaeon]|nr:hypothetical protein [Thermoplasmata archaeon]
MKMNKIFVAGVTCILLTITILPATPYQASMTNNFHIEKRDILTNDGGNILYVGGSGPENYSKIQNAIDNASDGDTVFVYDDSSPYYENIVINKSINLVGENKDTTVI